MIADYGGVAAVSTLTGEIRARLSNSATAAADPATLERADRAAGGLLRAALDRLSEHETASGANEFVRRRRDRKLALAADPMLLAAAEAAAARADDMVAPDRDAVIPPRPPPASWRRLQAGYASVSDTDTPVTPPSDARLVRLAAAGSRHAAVSEGAVSCTTGTSHRPPRQRWPCGGSRSRSTSPPPRPEAESTPVPRTGPHPAAPATGHSDRPDRPGLDLGRRER